MHAYGKKAMQIMEIKIQTNYTKASKLAVATCFLSRTGLGWSGRNLTQVDRLTSAEYHACMWPLTAYFYEYKSLYKTNILSFKYEHYWLRFYS